MGTDDPHTAEEHCTYHTVCNKEPEEIKLGLSNTQLASRIAELNRMEPNFHHDSA